MTEKMINFTRGVPPTDVFPVDDLIECAHAALRNDPTVLLQYGRSPGYLPLRTWLGGQYGVSPARILTGNSSLEVFRFVTQCLLEPGDRAFVESPSYDRSITLLRRAGAEVVGIELEEDGVNIEHLEEELERGAPALMYLITDFQNPMGSTTSLEKRQRLAELAEEYDFLLVEDAPYRMLRYWGEDIPSLWSLAPERVLHMSSYSKILAPGLRLGYLVAPEDIVGQLAAWAVDSYIGPVLPTQGMVYEYCQRGLLEPNVEHLRQIYRPRLKAILEALETHMPQANWTKPEGGFFVAVTLPEGNDVVSLRDRAAEVNVKLSDGRAFFPNPEDGERFLRIPFCSVTPEEIEEGVQRLASLL